MRNLAIREKNCRVLVGKFEGKRNLEDLKVDGKVIRKQIMTKHVQRHGLIRLKIGTTCGLMLTQQ